MATLRAASRTLITGALALGVALPLQLGAASPAQAADGSVVTPSAGLSVSVAKGSAFAPGSRIAKFSTVNSCTRDYYLLRSWMELFEANGGGTLTIQPGTYKMSSTVYIPSNTTIVLSPGARLVKTKKTCTRKFKASSSMFMLVAPSKGKVRGAVGGYDGAHDIAIIGAGDGTSVIDLDSKRNTLGIIAGHNKRVRIEGIRFQNMNNNHFIEMDANADSVIRNNEFLGATSSTRLSAEAVNLDTPDALTDGFGSVWSNLDRTPNLRVTVEGNTFANMVRGLGTHNFSGGKYHTGIVVRNNVFRTMRNDSIRVMNWRDSSITNNRFDSIWCPTHGNDCRGILASGAENLTVRANTFSNMARAIQFMPWANDDKAAVYGVTYNRLTSTNLADLARNNAGPGLQRAEAIINPQYKIFANATLVKFTGA